MHMNRFPKCEVLSRFDRIRARVLPIYLHEDTNAKATTEDTRALFEKVLPKKTSRPKRSRKPIMDLVFVGFVGVLFLSSGFGLLFVVRVCLFFFFVACCPYSKDVQNSSRPGRPVLLSNPGKLGQPKPILLLERDSSKSLLRGCRKANQTQRKCSFHRTNKTRLPLEVCQKLVRIPEALQRDQSRLRRRTRWGSQNSKKWVLGAK